MEGEYSLYYSMTSGYEKSVWKLLVALLFAILLLLALYLHLVFSFSKGDSMHRINENILAEVREALHKYLRMQKGNVAAVSVRKLLNAFPELGRKYNPQAIGLALYLLISGCGKIKINEKAWEAALTRKNSHKQTQWILVKTPNPYRKVRAVA